MSTPSSQRPGISLLTATTVVVANMIGTGVFTSLGFQVGSLPSGFTLLLLWTIGGLCALCGALAYGELAAALPRSGGEYHYLSRIYHPAVGFIAGWLSATVGFAAPIALASMAFGTYFSQLYDGVSATTLSIIVSILITLVHLQGLRTAACFQNIATGLKIALILAFIAAGLLMGGEPATHFKPSAGDPSLITSAPFAISLVYVMYAFAGWNAATYIAGEVRHPQRNVPLAIALGTLLVSVLYLALNAVFLRAVPMAELEGKLEIGHVVANALFGFTGGQIMSALICLGLVSSISAMVWVGPRVTAAMGQDSALLAPLGRINGSGVPVPALLLQLAIILTLLITSSFENVLTYVQFSIQLCSFLTVAGVMVLRHTHPDLPRPVRCWGYPFTPLFFLGVSLWMLIYLAHARPTESLAGLGTALFGLLLYGLSARRSHLSSPDSLS